jgi:hypothetical protein
MARGGREETAGLKPGQKQKEAKAVANQTRLEKDGGGDAEAFAQLLDVGFVEGALLMQDFGHDAFGAEDGHQVFLAEIIGIHQGAENLNGRSIGNGMMFFFVGLD